MELAMAGWVGLKEEGQTNAAGLTDEFQRKTAELKTPPLAHADIRSTRLLVAPRHVCGTNRRSSRVTNVLLSDEGNGFVRPIVIGLLPERRQTQLTGNAGHKAIRAQIDRHTAASD